MSKVKKVVLIITIVILVFLMGISTYNIHSYLILRDNNKQVELLSNIYSSIIDSYNDKDININIHRSALMNFITHKDFTDEEIQKLTKIITNKNKNDIENISQLKVMYNNHILTISIITTPSSDVINEEVYVYKISPKLNTIDYEKID